ncbi:hypothetical protein PQ465_14450 [Sphingobacterium oryzagri]|uniref:ABC-2 family transporter protein n=1 Tax=Sphingobacterium oryzagri TaxID=3025669 RepID=A0ABY7WG40_9SPHI|nr:hypothetical protein [Sphingobacterium sp. KACC 22765]WDF67496.1 hypothetical protein PQ465_14450 [Sphingobacterium sp. KACC 22765]
MSNTFHLQRFFSLITRQWIGFGKIYLMALTIAAGVIAAFYGYALYEFHEGISFSNVAYRDVLDFRVPLFPILGIFFVTIISGTYFSDYGQKAKAIFEVLIPASRLEKFLTAVFYTIIVSMVSYMIVYLLIDFCAVSYMRRQLISMAYQEDGNTLLMDRFAYLTQYAIPQRMMYFYFLPFLFNAIFLFGSIAFRNFQYIKTAVSMIIYIAVWSFATIYLVKLLTRDSVWVQQHTFWQEENHVYQLICAIGFLLTGVFWGLGYLRLKEKEV